MQGLGLGRQIMIVDVLLWVLGGAIIAGHLLQRWNYTPDWMRIRGPLLSVESTSGERLLERVAGPRRLWRRVTTVGTAVAFGGMAVMAAVLLLAATTDQTVTGSLEYTVFSFRELSVWYFLVFVFSIIIHELGHGVLCYVEDIEIETVGATLLAGIPLSAHIEQNVESRDKASVAARLRLFAAGVTNNFLLGLLAFVLLIGPVAGFLVAAPGVHVGSTVAGSPADTADVQRGDVIVALDGRPVANGSELDAALASTTNGTVQATLATGESVSMAPPPEPSNRSVAAFGIREHQTGQFLDRLGRGSIVDRVSFLLVAPFVSFLSTDYTHSLVGFAGPTAGFYTVSGPLAAFGDVGLVLASLLFWTVWINFVFGVTNCLPALPIDGGHLVRAATETVGTRLGIHDVSGLQTAVVLASTALTYVGLIAVLTSL